MDKPTDTPRDTTKPSHTPGPWEIIQLPSMAYRIDAKVGPMHVCPAIAHGFADACLIAASPVMLEALRKDEARLQRIRWKLDDWLHMTGTQRADFRNWIYQAECETRAAISAATGEETSK